MFKFLAKSFVLSLFVKRYRRVIVSTGLLFLFYFVVALIHDDYRVYSKAVDNQDTLAWALIAKWAAYVVATLAYYFINFPVFKGQTPNTSESEFDADSKQAKGGGTTEGESGVDPFSDIRTKRVLRRKGDVHLK